MWITWERFLTLLGLGLWIFDFVTDILTLVSYWRIQSTTIAELATTSMVLSTFVGLRLLYVVWKTLKCGDKHDNSKIIRLKAIEAMVESIPQLTINLYVLSICKPHTSWMNSGMLFGEKKDIPTIQYVSAAASFIGICVGVASLDKSDAEDGDYLLDWLEIFLLFMTKAFAIVARIFFLVYFAFFLGWWTGIFLIVHTMCLNIFFKATGLVERLIKKTEETGFQEAILFCALIVTLFQFVWFMFDDVKWFTISFSILYSIENIVLLVISLNVKIYFTTVYCLYSNVLWVNVGLNLACIFFALIYTYKRQGKNETLNGITKQIGKWSEDRKEAAINFVCCKNRAENEDTEGNVLEVAQPLNEI